MFHSVEEWWISAAMELGQLQGPPGPEEPQLNGGWRPEPEHDGTGLQGHEVVKILDVSININ